VDASDGGFGVALTIPVGEYTGCAVSTVEIAANLEASNGGNGTLTLSMNGGGGVSAGFSFQQFNAGNPNAHVIVASGTLAFAPTSGTTAASIGGPFAIETQSANYNMSLTVSVSASSLAIVGDTLFVSMAGQSDDTKFTGYVYCPVPASLPRATVVGLPSTMGSISTGTYGACTTAFVQLSDGSNSTGGDVSLVITEAGGVLTATSPTGFPSVCGGGKLAFHDISVSTATLTPGQTCPVQLPCGAPPTMGPSSTPLAGTLTNMAGSLAVVGGVLFVNVTGDAPQACGNHGLSFICPTAP
jgi:hypothetical protein